MRVLALATFSLLAAGLVGCGEPARHRCDRCGAQRPSADQPVEVLPAPVLQVSHAPSLLFDRVPGRYSATDFAYRSDWPSTNSYYSPGEVIYYHMYDIDYQGPGLNPWNSSYRRFTTRRAGAGYR